MENPRDLNSAPAQTVLCQSGCGFYGSAATDGLCSKCFKESLNRKQDPGRLSPTSVSSMGSADPFRSVVAATSFPMSDPIVPKLEREEHLASTSQAKADARAQSPPTADATSATSTATAEAKSCGEEARAMAAETKSSPSPSPSSTPVGEQATAEGDGQPPNGGGNGKKKNRCHECNKRVGLTGFNCRCGGIFCGLHRYSDMHKCTFDYRRLGEEEIRKNNPVVVSEKIQKI